MQPHCPKLCWSTETDEDKSVQVARGLPALLRSRSSAAPMEFVALPTRSPEIIHVHRIMHCSARVENR